MHFVLSDPRYVSAITYSKDAPAQERLAFGAAVESPYELIAADQGALRFGSVALAYNTRTREEVDAVLAEVAALGAVIVKPAE